jgi:ABC-type lipoprotein export system ATPase subunit
MLLKIDNLSKTYRRGDGAVHALQELSFEMEAGQFVAVCGPSGCGKSTLLLISGGLLRPDGGSVEIEGQDLYELSGEDRARFRAADIGFVFQQFHLVPYLNVLDNVLAASLGLPDHGSETQQRAEQLIEQFGLVDRAKHLPAELSVGERQRTAMARALLNRPKLILADEPTGNLDPDNADIVLSHLREFASGGGGVLLVTHDSESAERADQTIRIEAGRLVEPTVLGGAS